MLIDWFTVAAQAVNFLILVWLLKRFLYKPVLHAIDEREKLVAKELADADAKKAEAQKDRDDFQHKNEEFDKQRAALLSKATDEANAERQRLLDEARKTVDAWSTKRHESLSKDAENLNQAIVRRTQQEVFSIVRKTLADLATVSLEERVGEVFARRLREMNGQAKEGLGNALKSASAPAFVRSAFEMPANQRAAIQSAVNETFSADIHIQFETAPELVSGIELTTNGQKVAWSIADYLTSMETGVGELLREQGKLEAKAKRSSDLTPQIAKRAYELYEQQGHRSDSAMQNWGQAEREIRKGETKAAPKPEAPKPQDEPVPKPEVKAEPKPDPAPESEAEAKENKPLADSGLKPKIKPQAKPETTAEPKPEVKSQ